MHVHKAPNRIPEARAIAHLAATSDSGEWRHAAATKLLLLQQRESAHDVFVNVHFERIHNVRASLPDRAALCRAQVDIFCACGIGPH